MKKQFLEVGQIVSTHGIKGEVRLNPWCDSPAFLKQFKTLYFDNAGEKSVGVVSARPHSNIVILKLENVDTIEQAQALKNKVLYINRSDAKAGTVFVQDLIDCQVRDAETDVLYGKIKNVSENPANNIWHIVNDNDEEFLFPAVKPFIEKIDTDNGEILIKPIKGMFTAAEEIRDEN
ncbi:MAG: 16S rRNA processing protein RimM [Ruminococcaceae bacterium]|jgi:16S rRNA processing protein RimM|nr:16S rRNA processing protein RimM [Oscillospiraceae bacterium]